MKSTIRDLWKGNIHPCADFDKKLLPESAMKNFFDTHQDFMNKLGLEDRETLLVLINSLGDVWIAACEDAFESGFSLGVRLASESLGK